MNRVEGRARSGAISEASTLLNGTLTRCNHLTLSERGAISLADILERKRRRASELYNSYHKPSDRTTFSFSRKRTPLKLSYWK
ncbi:hypothetical protein NL676_034124 [Syzygium grande]|nr:hypothetical protein NL676_034124 [Syzygium grande]